MKALRKALIVASCLALCIAISACDSTSKPTNEQVNEQSSEQAEQPSATPASDYYDVAITGADVLTYEDGKQSLVVTFDYTNKTNTPVCFIQAAPTAAVQDGVALGQDTSPTGYTGTDGMTPDYLLKVDPGATTTVHMAFALASSSDVTVRCTLGFVDGEYPDPNVKLAEQTFAL